MRQEVPDPPVLQVQLLPDLDLLEGEAGGQGVAVQKMGGCRGQASSFEVGGGLRRPQFLGRQLLAVFGDARCPEDSLATFYLLSIDVI